MEPRWGTYRPNCGPNLGLDLAHPSSIRMIFEQALRRELSFTAGAVFLVLLTFMLTTLVIRILGMAANGEANPNDVLLLIGLATLGYLAILL